MLSVETIKGVINLRSVPTWIAGMGVVALLPMALACNQDPAPRYLRSALTLAAWGLWLVAASTLRGRQTARRTLGQMALYMAVSTLGASALIAPLWAGLPWGIALPAVMNLAAAALVITVTARCVYSGNGELLFDALCGGIVVVGLLNAAVALVQVFAPQYCDGDWIASGCEFLGRASGNLRQPNHLGTLMVWATVAVFWHGERRPKERVTAVALAASFVVVLMLTQSRSAALASMALPVWGLCDRSLSRTTRIALILSPVTYMAARYGLIEWAALHGYSFGDSERMTRPGSDLAVTHRLLIWQQTLELIRQNPWFGVGFGEFHFAWMLTPFNDRPEYFDHPHNLILYILVCMGIPIGGTIVLLLLFAFASGIIQAFGFTSERTRFTLTTVRIHKATYKRPAMIIVWAISVHSMLEYPLWYSYFLMPSAMMLALAISSHNDRSILFAGDRQKSARRSFFPRYKLQTLSAILIIAGAVFGIYDYEKITILYSEKSIYPPTDEQLRWLRSSTLTGRYADYEAILAAKHPSQDMSAFKRDPHHLLQPGVLLAWSKAYSELGDLDRARYLAARLAELPPTGPSVEFFAPCHSPEEPFGTMPFQCTPPTRELSFRDFR